MVSPVSSRGSPAAHTGSNSDTSVTPGTATLNAAAYQAVQSWGSQNFQTNKQRMEDAAKQITEKKDDDD